MSKQKHTPGPWASPQADMVTCGKGTICTVWLSDRYMTGHQAANARLIAAAPELLDALDTLLELHGQAVFKVDDCDRADAIKATEAARYAIAKATGGV